MRFCSHTNLCQERTRMPRAQLAEAPFIHTWATMHLNILWIHVHLPFPPLGAASQGALCHCWIQILATWVICTASITPGPATSVRDAHSGFLTPPLPLQIATQQISTLNICLAQVFMRAALDSSNVCRKRTRSNGNALSSSNEY